MSPTARAGRSAAPVRVLTGPLEPGPDLGAATALLRWWTARSTPHRPIEVVATTSGFERDRVAALAPVRLVHDPAGWSPARAAQRLRLEPLARPLRAVEVRRLLAGTGPVLVAGPGGARLLHWVPAAAGPVVAVLNERGNGLEGLAEVDRALLVSRVDRWVAGSARRRAELVEAGADPGVIVEVPDLVDLVDFEGAEAAAPDLVQSVRAELSEIDGIDPEAPLVVGVGAVDWWTVPDAFVRVAWELLRRPEAADVRVAWLADGATDRMLWPLRHDLDHAGLGRSVAVVRSDRPRWQLLAAADVLLDTRLGDAPAVGLAEAEVIGLPVVGFGGPAPSTGAAGLGEADGVDRVAHLDVDAAVDAVLTRLAGAAARRIDPGRGAPWMPAVVAPQVAALLEP